MLIVSIIVFWYGDWKGIGKTKPMEPLVKKLEFPFSLDEKAQTTTSSAFYAYSECANIAHIAIEATSEAYWYFLEANNLFDKLLFTLRGANTSSMEEISTKCKVMILEARIPYNLRRSLIKQYQKEQVFFSDVDEIYMVGSIFSERYPDAKFEETEILVKLNDWDSMIDSIKFVYASLFERSVFQTCFESGYQPMDFSVSVKVYPALESSDYMDVKRA